MKRILLEFLRDTLAAIAEIESFVEDVDSDGFAASREKVLAVVKLLEMIGEAVKQIPNDKRELYPDIPWKSIAGARDILYISTEKLMWLWYGLQFKYLCPCSNL